MVWIQIPDTGDFCSLMVTFANLKPWSDWPDLNPNFDTETYSVPERFFLKKSILKQICL